jgi:hypothetical protein
MNTWLAIGPVENWKIGIKKKIWAVSPAQLKSWERIRPGDTVFFYATAPVKGLIGCGTVGKTDADEKPFWPQELEKGHVIWPYRIRFSSVTHISPHDWESKRVAPERTGIVFQRAFQPVGQERAESWLKALAKVAV